MAQVLPPAPPVTPPAPADRLYVSPSDTVYVIDDDGRIWQRVPGAEFHLPASKRIPTWQHFPGPHGWRCESLKGGANGSLYAFFEGHLFEHTRDPNIQYGRNLYRWVEIPLPDAHPPAGVAAPQPILVHTATRTKDGFSKPFELPGGNYITQSQGPVAGIQRAGPRGFVYLDCKEGKFILPGPSTLKVDFGMSMDNPVAIYLDPPLTPRKEPT